MDKRKTIIGSWMKQKVIGKGSFGVVTLWQNIHTGDNLAIKLFREPDAAAGGVSPKQIERWAKEVEIVKRLSHPNLVVIRPLPEDLVFLAVKLPIMCMEYCEGGDLRKLFKEPENCSGLPEEVIRKLLRSIKDALEYLHGKNIIHRDLKPENIVIKEDTFKLIDLGYGKEMDQSAMLTTFFGTLQYLAPEVFSAHSYSASVDYWSFGLICHEAITGVRPFLPNLQPIGLKAHIEKKPNEVISIFETMDGSIEYSRELFPENHITSFLKDQFEDWLRLALEWNGKKRGRNNENKVVIFSHLDAILRKTIITVFSTFTLEQLSYEIDRSTLFSTLMRWIERDTKHPAENQILLSPAGEIVSEDDLVYKLWDPANNRAMIYAFDVDGLSVPKVQCKLPNALVQMLEDPKKTMPHYFIVRLNGNAIFFIQRQIYICETFVESCALKLLYTLNALKELDLLKESISSEIYSCRGNLNLHSSAIEYNEKHYNKHFMKCENVPDSWKRNYDGNLKLFLKYNAKSNELCLELEKLKFNFNEIESICESLTNDVEALKKRLDISFNYCKSLTDAPEEIRASESNATEIANELYACFELWHNFFSSDYLISGLQRIKECEQEADNLRPQFVELEEFLKSFGKKIISEHLIMTQSIWRQWASLTMESPATSPPQEQRPAPLRNNPRHMTLSEDAEALIKENRDLRVSFDETIYRFQIQQESLRERNESITKRLRAWNLISD